MWNGLNGVIINIYKFIIKIKRILSNSNATKLFSSMKLLSDPCLRNNIFNPLQKEKL